eukprot:12851543-Alexandrium_andersonii.AAC.1
MQGCSRTSHNECAVRHAVAADKTKLLLVWCKMLDQGCHACGCDEKGRVATRAHVSPIMCLQRAMDGSLPPLLLHLARLQVTTRVVA